MHIANTLKTAVACALAGAVATVATASGAHAQPDYDRKLAKAMAEKAAASVGGLRDGFAIDEAPVFAGRNDAVYVSPWHMLLIEGGQPADREIDGKPTGSLRQRSAVTRADVRVIYPG